MAHLHQQEDGNRVIAPHAISDDVMYIVQDGKAKKMDSLMVEDVFPNLCDCFFYCILLPICVCQGKIKMMELQLSTIKGTGITANGPPLQPWTSQQASLALRPVTPRLGCRC